MYEKMYFANIQIIFIYKFIDIAVFIAVVVARGVISPTLGIRFTRDKMVILSIVE